MLLTTERLRARGLSEAQIRSMVSTGRLRRLRRGVYEQFDGIPRERTPEEQHLRLIEATMHQHPDAVLSHVSAAVIHGLPLPQRSLGCVHLLRPATKTGSKRSGNLYLHRVTELPPTTVVNDFRVTGLDQTVLDLVRVFSPTDAVALADRALALGADRDEILDLMRQQPRRRGNELARTVLTFADPLSESPAESWARWVMAESGLPAPELQVSLFDPRTGRFVARPDFLWRHQQVVGEFDGRTKYARLRDPRQSLEAVLLAEKKRHEALRRLGFWVVRFDATDVFTPGKLREIVLDGFAYAPGARSA